MLIDSKSANTRVGRGDFDAPLRNDCLTVSHHAAAADEAEASPYGRGAQRARWAERAFPNSHTLIPSQSPPFGGASSPKGRALPSQSPPFGGASSPKGRAFALSVSACGRDSSPRGRASGAACAVPLMLTTWPAVGNVNRNLSEKCQKFFQYFC